MAAITKPDDIYNLASVLGTTNDVAALCTASSIRKWNKCKPVNRNTIDELTADQRRGAADAPGVPSDRNVNRGWFYGLKIATSQSSDWTDIHEVVTLDYDAPTGGISVSPHRMLDFIGYDHGQGNPCRISLATGDITAVESLEHGIDVRIEHSGNQATDPDPNGGGVNVAWCCDSSKANVYPVVVLTRNGVSYACALRLDNDNDNKSRPIWYQNACKAEYHVSFANFLQRELNVDYQMSFGVVVKSNTQAANVFDVCDGRTPIWQQVPETGFVQRFFGLEGGMNRKLKIFPSDPTPDLSGVAFAIVSSMCRCTDYYLSTTEAPGGPYYVSSRVRIQSNTSTTDITKNSGEYAALQHGETRILPVINIYLALVEQEVIPLPGEVFTITADLWIGPAGEPRKHSESFTLSWTYNP